MTPDFLLLGAAKAGTTSMSRYLHQHPQLFVARKDLNHFLDYPAKRSLFQGPDITFSRGAPAPADYAAAFADAPPGSTTGDASHVYLYAPEAAERIRATLGEPRMIAVLRDPLERAYSEYCFLRRLGLEVQETFEGALEIETMRFEAGWDPVFHYARRGRYGEQLARFQDVFSPENLLVLLFEELFEDLPGRLPRVLEFLGVDPTILPDTSEAHMPAGDARAPEVQKRPAEGLPSVAPMEAATRARLRADYAEDRALLASRIDLDLDRWWGREESGDVAP